MRKSKKQLMKSGIAGLLIASRAVGGRTLAYLTDAETTDNTFTVGKVKIALSEPNYPGNESEQVKDLVPNEIVKKDPQIKNVGINDAIIYLKVEVPKANVTVVGDGGARGDKKVQEIFTLKNLKTGNDGTWMDIRKDDSATDKCVYVFAYKAKLAKDAITTPLFDVMQLKNVLEREIDATTQDIKINEYAIQADNILDVDTTTLDKVILDKVYDIYVNQSGDKQAGADSGDNKGDSKDNQKSGTSVLLTGQTLSKRMKILAVNSSATYGATDTTITAIQYSDTEPSEEVKADANSLVSTNDSEKPIYMWFEDGVIKWWSEAETIKAGKDLRYLCASMEALSDISGLTNWNIDNVTDMYWMFRGCKALTDLTPLSTWNTENVTSIGNTFQLCTSLTSLNALSNWNTDNVTSMSYLFDACSAVTDLNPLANWNTDKVYTMQNTFDGCGEITDLSPLANWNTNHVTDMTNMFTGCTKLTDLRPLADWNTGNVTKMSWMFAYCSNLVDLSPLANWDIKNVTKMDGMFCDCNGLTNLNGLSTWNTGNVTDMTRLFDGCDKLSDASAINDWNIAKVTGFVQMFRNCPSHPEFTQRVGTWYNGSFTPTI